jgi:linoleoyl-CoA desaturase
MYTAIALAARGLSSRRLNSPNRPRRAKDDMSQAVKAKFLAAGPFHRDLKMRVERYFADSGVRRRDLPGMYLKTAIILAWFAASWTFLVFFASGPLATLAGCVSLALAVAGVGFSVQHDANHGGYSESRLVNDVLGTTLDLMGASSYIWRWKHNVYHHTHPNVVGLDDDVEVGIFGRLAPAQPHRGAYQFQHFYMWFLYGFLAMRWHLMDDVVNAIRGRIGTQKLPRPRGWKLVHFVACKIAFFGWALVVPALFHPLWQVAVAYALTSFVLGVTLSVAFQLAHCVSDADFPEIPSNGSFDRDWAVHQIRTTVDFAPRNRLVTWYLGGLNFQVVHHLFPHVCHLHYPTLSRIVDETCRAHGLQYHSHPTLRAALGSHARWLKQMGGALPSPVYA